MVGGRGMKENEHTNGRKPKRINKIREFTNQFNVLNAAESEFQFEFEFKWQIFDSNRNERAPK